MKTGMKASKSYKKKEEESGWFDFIFPETDILFKNVLSIFIIFYILDVLLSVIQFTNSKFAQLGISLLILWTVLSFVVHHLRQILDFNKFKISLPLK